MLDSRRLQMARLLTLVLVLSLMLPLAVAISQEQPLVERFIVWIPDWAMEPWVEVLEPEFEIATGIGLEIIGMPETQLYEELERALRAGLPLDVVMLQNERVCEFAKLGLLTDLTDYREHFFREGLVPAECSGIYGIDLAISDVDEETYAISIPFASSYKDAVIDYLAKTVYVGPGAEFVARLRQIRSLRPDLYVSNITFSDSAPTHGGSVRIDATVVNQGAAAARDFQVAFYDDYPDGTKILLGSQSISKLDSGTSTTLSRYLTNVLYGQHGIRVVADSNNNVREADEDNNERKAYLTADCPHTGSHSNHVFLGHKHTFSDATNQFAASTGWGWLYTTAQADVSAKKAHAFAEGIAVATVGAYAEAYAAVFRNFKVFDSTQKRTSASATIKVQVDYNGWLSYQVVADGSGTGAVKIHIFASNNPAKSAKPRGTIIEVYSKIFSGASGTLSDNPKSYNAIKKISNYQVKTGETHYAGLHLSTWASAGGISAKGYADFSSKSDAGDGAWTGYARYDWIEIDLR